MNGIRTLRDAADIHIVEGSRRQVGAVRRVSLDTAHERERLETILLHIKNVSRSRLSITLNTYRRQQVKRRTLAVVYRHSESLSTFRRVSELVECVAKIPVEMWAGAGSACGPPSIEAACTVGPTRSRRRTRPRWAAFYILRYAIQKYKRRYTPARRSVGLFDGSSHAIR